MDRLQVDRARTCQDDAWEARRGDESLLLTRIISEAEWIVSLDQVEGWVPAHGKVGVLRRNARNLIHHGWDYILKIHKIKEDTQKYTAFLVNIDPAWLQQDAAVLKSSSLEGKNA